MYQLIFYSHEQMITLKVINYATESWDRRVYIWERLYGPQREKPCLRGFANKIRCRPAPWHPHRLISTFVFRFFESTISRLATSEISIASLWSWGDWFESCFFRNSEDTFCHGEAHICTSSQKQVCCMWTIEVQFRLSTFCISFRKLSNVIQTRFLIPDLCTLTYFDIINFVKQFLNFTTNTQS